MVTGGGSVGGDWWRQCRVVTGDSGDSGGGMSGDGAAPQHARYTVQYF